VGEQGASPVFLHALYQEQRMVRLDQDRELVQLIFGRYEA